MNWLFWVVVAFLAYHVFDGLRRGFIRKVVAALSLVITLVLVTFVTPHITNFIHTGIYYGLCKIMILFHVFNV